MVLFLGMAALVVDLGGLRLDKRADRLASDAAATAGVALLDPYTGSDAQQSCQTAWAYLLINLTDEGTPSSTPNCAVFAGACNPATARVATGVSGPYTFQISHPIPDGHAWMGGQAINASDGASCQRFGVSIQRARNVAFAQVMGFGAQSTTVRSVARIAADVGGGEFVPLLVLEPFACNALYVSGQGGVTVSYFMDTPGFIVVDSNGSGPCVGQARTIEAQGSINGWIRALPVPAPQSIPSAILSYALSGTTGADPLRSYNPANLTQLSSPCDPTEEAFTCRRLYPQPGYLSRRITRAPIDWRYNCKASYPNYLVTIPIAGCPNVATDQPFIDQLVTKFAPPGLPDLTYQQWFPTYPCQIDDTTWLGPPISETGNWWVNCPSFVVGGSQVVTFTDGDVVFDGDVGTGSFGQLRINPAPTNDHIVYLRNGSLDKGAQSTISLNQTFVYISIITCPPCRPVDLVGGAGGLTWTAPLGGNFEDLALWSESAKPHEIGGQAGNTLTGTFFTPLADPFMLSGQGGQFQTDAQFLTRRLEVTGQAGVKMHPDPQHQTPIPIRAVMLIR
jgi:hypothetical protein